MRHKDGYGSERAHQTRVDGRAEHSHEPLANRFGIFRSTVHKRSRTHARLIDIHGTTCAHDSHAGKSAKSRFEIECALNDFGKHLRKHVQVGDNHIENEYEIHRYHGRHYLGGEMRDASDAAKHHHSHGNDDENANKSAQLPGVFEMQQRVGDYGNQRLGELVGLHHAQATNHGKNAEKASHRAQLRTDALGEHIHRTALHIAEVVLALIHYSQCALEEFGGHTE